MNNRKAKYERKKVKQFIISLLSNMSFWDRLRFCFDGNYVKPLQRTIHKLEKLDQLKRVS